MIHILYVLVVKLLLAACVPASTARTRHRYIEMDTSKRDVSSRIVDITKTPKYTGMFNFTIKITDPWGAIGVYLVRTRGRLPADRPTEPNVLLSISGPSLTNSSIFVRMEDGDVVWETTTSKLLKENVYTDFWLKWNHHGYVYAGFRGNSQPFLDIQNPYPFPICCAVVRTIYGDTPSSWKFVLPPLI